MSALPRMRELREDRLMTQDNLARLAGLTHNTVNRIERGARLKPTMMTVRKIANALGVTPAELGWDPRANNGNGTDHAP